MMVSFIAINRILEKQAAEDPAVRRRLERSGKVVLSQARSLLDADLLARLRSFGIELEPKLYRELCSEHLSAEEISLALLGSRCRLLLEVVSPAYPNRQVRRIRYRGHRSVYCALTR